MPSSSGRKKLGAFARAMQEEFAGAAADEHVAVNRSFWGTATATWSPETAIITTREIREKYRRALGLPPEYQLESDYKPGWREAIAWLEARELEADRRRQSEQALAAEWPWPVHPQTEETNPYA